MTTRRSALALVAVAALIVTVTAQSQWYALYDEAVKHVLAGEFKEAETKLLQAKKDGPSSGRNVLRYGSLRAPYFPDYYLGVVYVSTGRPQEALDAFARARQANIDAKNNEFKPIGTFEGQANAALTLAKNNPGGPKPPPPGPSGPDPAAVRASALKDFEGMLAAARSQLAKKDFDGAERSATAAKNLSDQRGLGAGQRADEVLRDLAGAKQVAAVEDAVSRKDATGARQAWAVLNATAPTFADPTLRARVERLEKESAPPPPSVPAIAVTPGGGSNAATNTAAFVSQFEGLLTNGRNQLGQRSFDAADQSANNASRLAIKQGLGQTFEQRAEALARDVDIGRRTARVEAAIKGRDVAAARRELSGLAAVFPGFDAKSLIGQVDRIDNEINATALQRNAMRAFFNGGYQESLTMVAQIERTGMLTARTQFYRACSLAALAATSPNPAQDRRLADAKRFYAEAAKTPDQFREDLRYISPKVRQLLGI